MQTLFGNKGRGQWDLGTSCVNYIPMLDACPWDLGTSLENCIPMLDVCPWDLGMSLSRTAPTNNTKVTRQGGRGTHNLFLFL